jgi:hypothetical protein
VLKTGGVPLTSSLSPLRLVPRIPQLRDLRGGRAAVARSNADGCRHWIISASSCAHGTGPASAWGLAIRQPRLHRQQRRRCWDFYTYNAHAHARARAGSQKWGVAKWPNKVRSKAGQWICFGQGLRTAWPKSEAWPKASHSQQLLVGRLKRAISRIVDAN